MGIKILQARGINKWDRKHEIWKKDIKKRKVTQQTANIRNKDAN